MKDERRVGASMPQNPSLISVFSSPCTLCPLWLNKPPAIRCCDLAHKNRRMWPLMPRHRPAVAGVPSGQGRCENLAFAGLRHSVAT